MGQTQLVHKGVGKGNNKALFSLWQGIMTMEMV